MSRIDFITQKKFTQAVKNKENPGKFDKNKFPIDSTLSINFCLDVNLF